MAKKAIIRYCCYYCRKLNTKECPKGACYNALGGEEHFKFCLDSGICTVKDGACAESFSTKDRKRIPVVEANKDCWEEKRWS
jgi:hypothetical protein